MPKQMWKTIYLYILYELMESNNYAGQPSIQIILTNMQKLQMRVPFNFFAHSCVKLDQYSGKVCCSNS